MGTRYAVILALAVWSPVALVAPARAGEPRFTTDFGLEHCGELVSDGGNLYWSLEPGTFRRYEGNDDGEFVELEITVLNETLEIEFEIDGRPMTATARIIEEREWADGELVEVSRNYFARCAGSGNVFYFGEQVDIYEDGKVVSHDGAWLAGEDGALPGLIMPELFLLGSRYVQEVAPGVAMDRAEHVEMDLVVRTPAGEFIDCVKVIETTPLEPGAESEKIYAPGVGLIVDDVLELVSVCRADVNDDGGVDASDLALMLGAWFRCPDERACPSDLNHDGVVNASDLAILLGDWGCGSIT